MMLCNQPHDLVFNPVLPITTFYILVSKVMAHGHDPGKFWLMGHDPEKFWLIIVSLAYKELTLELQNALKS